MSDQSHEVGRNGRTQEIPAERARQGITGVHLRHVLAASTVGAVIAIGVVYVLAV